jgi:hypothetical protein
MLMKIVAFLHAVTFLLIAALSEAEDLVGNGTDEGIQPAQTVREARGRAKLLHETIQGSLQVMHRDFFVEDESRAIPSASLEDVFGALSKRYKVDMKWLVVDTDVVNVDHLPQGAFEIQAARELAGGKPRFEAVDNDHYRYAGSIRLASQCLKCHVKDRTSIRDRTAGLLISMPLEPSAEDAEGHAHKTH